MSSGSTVTLPQQFGQIIRRKVKVSTPEMSAVNSRYVKGRSFPVQEVAPSARGSHLDLRLLTSL